MRPTLALALLSLLLATHAGAEARFLDGATVRNSPYYTGTAATTASPLLSAQQWIGERYEMPLSGRPLISRFHDDDAQLRGYLHGVLQRLLAPWPGAAPPIQVFIQIDDLYGANATEFNEIFITTGALRDIVSEDELAALLAHEAGHILLNHFKRIDYFEAQGKLIERGGQVAALASYVENSTIQSSSRGRRVVSDTRQIAADFSLISSRAAALNIVAEDVWAMAWSREQETQADRLAVDLMVAAGYNSNSLVAAIERIGSAQSQRESLARRYAVEQQAAMQKQLGSEITRVAQGRNGSRIDDKKLTDASVNALKSVTYGAVQDIWGKARESHADPTARTQALQKYYATQYDALIPPPVRTEEYTQGLSPTGIRRVEQHNTAVATLRELAAPPGGARQRLQVDAPVTPFQHYVAFRAHDARRQRQQAYQLTRSLPLSPLPSETVFVDVADFYTRNNYTEEAAAWLQQGRALYGTDEPFYTRQITAHRKAGNTDRAQAVAQECYRSANRHLRDLCANAAGVNTQDPAQKQARKKKPDTNPFLQVGDEFRKLGDLIK